MLICYLKMHFFRRSAPIDVLATYSYREGLRSPKRYLRAWHSPSSTRAGAEPEGCLRRALSYSKLPRFEGRDCGSASVQFCTATSAALWSASIRARRVRRPGIRTIAWRLELTASGAARTSRDHFSGLKVSVIVWRFREVR